MTTNRTYPASPGRYSCVGRSVDGENNITESGGCATVEGAMKAACEYDENLVYDRKRGYAVFTWCPEDRDWTEINL